MNADLVIRSGAVVLAVALIAAPYWKAIAGLLARAWETTKAYRADVARVSGAVILIAVAWGVVPSGLISTGLAATAAKLAVGVTAVVCGALIFTPRGAPWWLCGGSLLAAGGILLADAPLPRMPIRLPVAQATSAVYVYEKDATPVPPSIVSEIDKLNRERKITATLLEVDTVDGTGETPEQYRPAVEAAKKATLPAFVVLSGTTVISTVSSPKELIVP